MLKISFATLPSHHRMSKKTFSRRVSVTVTKRNGTILQGGGGGRTWGVFSTPPPYNLAGINVGHIFTQHTARAQERGALINADPVCGRHTHQPLQNVTGWRELFFSFLTLFGKMCELKWLPKFFSLEDLHSVPTGYRV